MGRLTAIGLCVSCLLLAGTKTQRMDLPSGGLLRLNHWSGELRIEAWDQPDVEIMASDFATERRADELVLTANSPLDCHLFVPRSARLAIEQGSGNIFVDGVEGDIQASASQGTILLRLPEQGRYEIDARSKWGSIHSDFPGEASKAPWLIGHRFLNQGKGSARKLHLRVGYGDVVILKGHPPTAPPPR